MRFKPHGLGNVITLAPEMDYVFDSDHGKPNVEVKGGGAMTDGGTEA
jgi:hypothetical protein